MLLFDCPLLELSTIESWDFAGVDIEREAGDLFLR